MSVVHFRGREALAKVRIKVKVRVWVRDMVQVRVMVQAMVFQRNDHHRD